MDLLAKANRTQGRAGFQHGTQSEAGERRPSIHRHGAEGQDGVGGEAVPDEAGDEGVPRDRVPDGHSVEHVEGVAEEAAPGVHVEQGGGGDGVEVG